MRTNTLKKTVLGLFLATTLVGLAACGGDGDDKASDDESSSESSSESAAGEPDLDDIPDVVAEVNDEEISKEEFSRAYEGQFQQASAQAQQTGQPVDQDQLKEQVADNLVGTELMAQEADERGITVSDADIDKNLDQLAQDNGLKSADEFIKALKEQDLTEDDIRADVENQVMIEQLIADEGGNAKPTEQELRKVYEDAKKQAKGTGQKVPAFDKVRSQVVEQVKSNKQNEVAGKLVKELRADGDVTINL